MKKLITIIFLSCFVNSFSQVPIQRIVFQPNNLKTFFQNTGIYNQNTTMSNSPGLEWPAGSGKFVAFSSGISMACFVRDTLAFVSASYRGEYAPGYFQNGVFTTNPNFKIYSIKSGDNCSNSQDYANWGLMVPYGAPFKDVNKNGQYDCSIDIPGYPNASQTIFMCLTDGDQSQKSWGEGFSGGVMNPLLKAQVAITAWGYDNPAFENVQFIKYQITNKHIYSWKSFHLGLMVDADIGDAVDDRAGCDSTKNLGFIYNGTNYDNDYGANPPALGFLVLRSPALNRNGVSDTLGMSSLAVLKCGGCTGPVVCNGFSNGSMEAFNMMRGLKNKGYPVLNPVATGNSRITKYNFSGDPESGTGWNETNGFLANCSSDTNIISTSPMIPGDRRILLNSGHDSLIVNPGQTIEFAFAQYVDRGLSNLNSVTRLKNKVSAIKTYFNSVSGSVNISTLGDISPQKYELFQNYPNPFNPETTIKFNVPEKSNITLEIFDISGRFIKGIKSIEYNPGSYEFTFDGSNLASGIYFYRLTSNKFSQTKKMILLK